MLLAGKPKNPDFLGLRDRRQDQIASNPAVVSQREIRDIRQRDSSDADSSLNWHMLR